MHTDDEKKKYISEVKNTRNYLKETEEKMVFDKITKMRNQYLSKEFLDSKDINAYRACISSPFETLCYLDMFIQDFSNVLEKQQNAINDMSKKSDELMEVANKQEKKHIKTTIGLAVGFIVLATLFITDILITIYSYWFLHKAI